MGRMREDREGGSLWVCRAAKKLSPPTLLEKISLVLTLCLSLPRQDESRFAYPSLPGIGVVLRSRCNQAGYCIKLQKEVSRHQQHLDLRLRLVIENDSLPVLDLPTVTVLSKFGD